MRLSVPLPVPLSVRWLLALWLAASVFAASGAHAASLQISPISLSLQTQQRAGAFTLGNLGSAPLTAQGRVFRWEQDDKGADVLTPSDALVVSPPMVKLEAHSEQQFRVIRTQPAGALGESYRLIVDELPAPSDTPRKGLQLVLRYSVPVFLNSSENPQPTLLWQFEPQGKGKTALVVHNTGTVRAQIGRVWVERGAGKEPQPVNEGLAGYVLPGKRLLKPLSPLAASLRAGVWKAVINGREMQLDFVTVPPAP